jgi:hypothetical protein
MVDLGDMLRQGLPQRASRQFLPQTAAQVPAPNVTGEDGVPTSLEHFPTLRPVPCYQNRIRPGFSPLELHYQSFKRRGLLISRDYPQRSATKVCGELPHSNGLFPLSVGFCAVDVGTPLSPYGSAGVVCHLQREFHDALLTGVGMTPVYTQSR